MNSICRPERRSLRRRSFDAWVRSAEWYLRNEWPILAIGAAVVWMLWKAGI